MYLVSFVNQVLSPSLRLGAFSDDFSSFSYLDHNLKIDAGGATGLEVDATRKLIYVAYQNYGIVVFDETFKPVQIFVHDLIRDPHSIMLHHGNLLVVSTGRDAVVNVKLNSEGICTDTEVFWKNGDSLSDKDTIHLNSIVQFKDEILVSSFEWSPVEQGRPKKSGVIRNVTTGEFVLQGLSSPHSMKVVGDRLFILDSSASRIVDETGAQIYFDEGYLRGLEYCDVGKQLVFAKNKRRTLSKSRKVVLKGRVGDYESDILHSSIEVYSFESKKVIRSTPFEAYGRELYDIKFLPWDIDTGAIDSKALRIENTEKSFISKILEVEHSYEKKIEVASTESHNALNSIKLKCSELEKENKFYAEKVKLLESLNSDLEDTKLDLVRTKDKCRELKIQKECSDEKVCMLEKVLARSEGYYESFEILNKRFAALIKENENQTSFIGKLLSENKELNERIENKNAALQTDNAALKTEISVLKNELQAESHQRKSISEKNLLLEKIVNRSSSDLDSYSSRVESLLKENRFLNNRYREIEGSSAFTLGLVFTKPMRKIVDLIGLGKG